MRFINHLPFGILAKLVPVYYHRERGGEREKEKKGRKETSVNY